MSKNISQLARRKGVDNTLFETLVVDVGAKTVPERREVAKQFLMGEAIVHGTASFYDFIDGENADKKAYVCNGSSCLCAGTQAKVKHVLESKFGQDEVGHVTCLGRCSENAAFQLEGENFSGKDLNNIDELIANRRQNDFHAMTLENYHVDCSLETPILTAEIPNVGDYYQRFIDVVDKFTPNELLQKITDSGLRGRGGAGFPTGFKWTSCRDVDGEEKYIVCNADEGDAGAYSDRYLLEQRPHAVLFGMLMAGYLVGSDTGVLYIRDEYPAAIKETEQAISAFEKWFSANEIDIKAILSKSQGISSDWHFKFKIIRGAGAYICGEETALLRSIEGQRPVVSVRPPFPTQSGLFGCPTVLNNVETFASIHFILGDSTNYFAALGNGKSTGSKLISLDSSFVIPGIYEVAMGSRLSDVIEQAGGYSHDLKALHIGGPLGGVVPINMVDDLTVDFESFSQAGFLLGHASIIGIPKEFPIIEYMEHLFEFTADESCGKCYPCSLGSVRGKEMLEQAISGEKAIDKTLLNELLETMQLGSLCALGGGVPLPIQNMLQYFEGEIRPFIEDSEQFNVSGGMRS